MGEEWTSIANWSFAMSIMLFIKDVTLISLYLIRKFIDQSSNPAIRPKGVGKILSKVSRE